MGDTSNNEWVQTYTGKIANIFKFKPSSYCIEDVAHSLSNQCRFYGHTRTFYSVAEHSVHVSELVELWGGTIDDQRWGLLHDAAEPYIGDIAKPIKHRAGDLPGAEDGILRVIAQVEGLAWPMPGIVKKADRQLLQDERTQLLAHNVRWDMDLPDPRPDFRFPLLRPGEARNRFMARKTLLDLRREEK